MRKLKTLFTVLFLAVLGLGNVWAADATIAYSGSTTTNMTGNNDAATVGLNADTWSVVAAKGGNSNFPGLNKAGQIRLYGATNNHNTITVSNLSDKTISTIVVTYGNKSNNNAKVTAGTSTDEVSGSGTDTEKTYTINATSFTITHNYSATTQVYISKIEINLSSSSDPDPEPTKYTVTVADGIANGTVTASPTSAKEGDVVTLTATPSTGYEFGEWNVTNASTSAAITVTDNKFQMPAANVNVSATFNEVQADEYTHDVLTNADFAATGTSYTDFSNVSKNTAVYAGNSAKNNGIQLRSNNSNSGIVSTTSGGKIKTVTVAWNSNCAAGRVIDVYGSNTAYTSAADLYSSSAQGTKLGSITQGTSTSVSVTDDYAYVGIRSNSGSLNIDQIDFAWEEGGSDPEKTAVSVTVDNEQSIEVDATLDVTSLFTVTTADYDGSLSYAIKQDENKDKASLVGTTLTGVAAGVVTIVATAEATENFAAVNKEATVTVTAPVVPFTGETWEIAASDLAVLDASQSSGYARYAGTQTKDGVDYNITAVMPQTGNMQMQKNNGVIYNETTFGKIEKITVASTNSFKMYEGAAMAPSTEVTGATADGVITYNFSGNNGYFKLVNATSGAATVSLIKVYYYPVKSAITFASCENGSVGVDGIADLTQVKAGTTVTLTNTPADGYKLAEYDVYKTGDAATKVTVTDGKFTMPAYDVTVSATFEVAKVLDGTVLTLGGEYPTEFWKGDAFSHDGMTVTAHFNTGDETVTGVFSGYDMTTAGTQTVTVTYTEGLASQTATYEITVKTIANTQETAYTTTEAIAIIEAGKDLSSEVYVKGKVSDVESFNEKFSSITYWLDGKSFEVYSGKGIDGADFASIDDIAVNADVIIKGIIKKFGSVYEFDKNNVLVYYKKPEVVKTNPTLTISGYYTSMSADDDDNEFTVEYNGDGELSVTSSNEAVAEAIIIDNTVVVEAKTAGTTTITVSATETATYNAVSKSYTLTVKAGLSAAALPFNFDGGKADMNVANGIKQTGLGDDYSTSPKLRFDNTNDEVIIRVADAIKRVEYSIKGNSYEAGQFDILQSADGKTYTALKSYTDDMPSDATVETTAKPAADTRYIKFVYTTKNKGNVALGAIKISAASELDSPELAFDQASYTFFADAASMQVTATSAAGSTGAITYALTEGDADAFLIDENTGDIVCETAGTYTVTATIAATAAFATQSVDAVVTINEPEDLGDAISIVFPYGETFYAMKKDMTVVEVIYANNKLINVAEADKADLTWYKKVTDGNVTFRNAEGKYLGTGSSNSITLSETAVNWTLNSEKGYYYCGDATTRTFLLKDEATVKNYAVTNAGSTGYSEKPVFATGFATAELQGISLSGEYTTEFTVGATFEHEGLIVTANYEGGASKIVTEEATFSTPDMSVLGEQTVTVSFGGRDATYTINVVAATPVISVDKIALAFGTVNLNATVEDKTVAVTLENLAEATVALTGSDKFAIDITSLTESGNVTVSVTTDVAGEYAATLTISGEGVESKTVALSMTVVTPDACEGTDDFETATSESASSYNSRTTTDGWSATNAALTTIDDEKFLTINGKTTAVGVITSPVIEGGLKDLKIRYANTMSEENGAKFRVDVKVADKVVYTETVTRSNADMTQNEIYTAEFTDMKVLGDCQIVITNLSPSNNSSKNKDRLSIGRICYTTYAGLTEERPLNGMGTHCYPFTIAAGEYTGASFYQIDYKKSETSIVWVEETGVIEAGVPYLVVLNEGASALKYLKGDDEAVDAQTVNGLVGSYTQEWIEANAGNYIIYNGEFCLAGNYVAVGANRAYIHLEDVSDTPKASAPAGARRFVMHNTEGTEITTGINGANGNLQTSKMLINGRIYILRGENIYDVNGTIVK